MSGSAFAEWSRVAKVWRHQWGVGGYLAKMFAVSFAGDVLAGFVADDGIPALVQPPHEIRRDFWVDRYDSVLARFGLETPLQVSAIL